MTARRASTIVAVGLMLALVSVAGSTATASPTPRHTVGAKAWMYTRIPDLRSSGPIQVLNRLCPGAWPAVDGCIRIGDRLRRAISRRVSAPLTWVAKNEPDGGTFWVFSPIRFFGERARLLYRWHEEGQFACAGHGRLRFQWSVERSRWRVAGGSGAAGCP